MERVARVVVVGGGVVGVGSALALLQRVPHCHLTILTSQLSPHTTGDGAAGFWGPYLRTGTPEDKIMQWSQDTFNLFHNWWTGQQGEGAKRMGVSLVNGTVLSDQPHGMEEPWLNIQLSSIPLTQEKCAQYGPNIRSGYSGGTFTAEPARFLPVLLEEVKCRGGRVEVRHLSSLQEAATEADLVINCSGLGARDLVPDSFVYPIRGQVMRVHAPWVGNFLCDDSDETFGYIIPNQDSVVLGGTHQDDDWRLEVDPQDSQRIWQRCTELMPSLKGAEVVREWVGLRPARRKGVRLETDQIRVGSRTVPVVHNYGHGGCGVSLFWGCGLEAANIAADLIHKHYHPVSKL